MSCRTALFINQLQKVPRKTVETFGVSIHFEKGGEWVSKNRVNQPHDQVS